MFNLRYVSERIKLKLANCPALGPGIRKALGCYVLDDSGDVSLNVSFTYGCVPIRYFIFRAKGRLDELHSALALVPLAAVDYLACKPSHVSFSAAFVVCATVAGAFPWRSIGSA